MAEMSLYSPPALEEFVRNVFEALGCPQDVAAEVARHLVRSNLSGHDSHGVIRVAQYVDQIDSGEIAPAERPVLINETAVAALVDARRSMGLYSTTWAMDWAMERARQQGLAAAAIRHSTHIGRVGEYAEQSAGRGLISIVTVGAGGPGVGGMIPFGGSERFLGANPWAIGIPSQGGPPLVFDGSTSTVAEGKVRVARDKGAPLPPDCITDPQGKMSTDPNDFYVGGGLIPLGGKVAGHKGSGLAMASALLSALAMIDDPNPTFIGAPAVDTGQGPRGRLAGVFLIVVDPSAFGNADSFQAMVAENLAAAKRVPPAEGVSEVLIPGELESKTRERRARKGIPLAERTRRDLAAAGKRLGLSMPAPLS